MAEIFFVQSSGFEYHSVEFLSAVLKKGDLDVINNKKRILINPTLALFRYSCGTIMRHDEHFQRS